ncbi:MAG TPA: hypothetical protein VI298_06895 [Geobacteraceae bacterium]
MKNPLRTMTMVVAALFSFCWSVPCHAAESTFKGIFTDSLYGGLTGTLVGGAIMAFAKKPGDHLDYLGYGAAVGVLTGAAYGIGKAVVEMDRGRVSFSLPTVIPDLGEANSRGQAPLILTANLIRGKF